MNWLEINQDGLLSFRYSEGADYEVKSLYEGCVTVSDGTNFAQQGISININNINDTPPSFGSQIEFTVNENQTAIGTVTATDAEAQTAVRQFTITISHGATGGGQFN